MRRFFFGFRFRLILLVLPAVLPALGLTLYTGLEQRRLAAEAAQQDALRLARSAAQEQELLIQGTYHLLVALAQLPLAGGDDPAACNAFFLDLLDQYQGYSGFTVARPNGDVFCSAPALAEPVNLADRPWFERLAQTRDFVVGDYLVGRVSGKAVMVCAFPVLGADGQLQAIVTAGLDLAWLSELVAQAQLPEGTTLTVIDHNGTVLARHPDPGRWVGQTLPEAAVVRAILTKAGEGTVQAQGLDGVSRLYAFAPLGDGVETGAFVAVGIHSTIAFADAEGALVRNLALLGLAALLALSAAWVGGNLLITRPVQALLRTTEQLATGDLSTRAKLHHGIGELRQLASTLDQMVEALEQRVAERKRAEEALKGYSERLEQMVEERTKELREAQDRLVRNEKLAVLGQLPGGVGHELRNPLGVISNATYYLQMSLAPDQPGASSRADETTATAREYLEIIASQVHKAEKIVSDLLDFSRTRPAERQEIAVSQLVAEVLNRQPPPDEVEVVTRIPSDLPPVFVDLLQIEQVLGNLITNAYQAMPLCGSLTLSAQAEEASVRLAVTDTGCGIPPENLDKIFEPLFTTRARGIGLGLAVSKNLVEVNGGSIQVESQEGQGSTFTVTLPTREARP
jgi:signal transduction histidine kinase